MLHTLKINNVALINELIIEFKPNLNVLTGETGAGKSIIIDSLNFLLGARADKTLIRSGESDAKVVGVFRLNEVTNEVTSFFEKIGLPVEDTIIITRQMNINGKSLTQVNGEFVTAAMLRDLTSHLIDIHGQNEHQFLLDVKNQLAMIDDFYFNDIHKVKQEYLEILNKIKTVNEQIALFGGSEEDRLRQIDLLSYEVNEISAMKLNKEEEQSLLERLKKMQNIEKIATQLSQAQESLLGGGQNGVLTNLTFAIHSLNAVSQFDKQIEQLVERFESVKLELDDAIYEVSNIIDGLEFDEKEYETLDERLEQIKKLKRKYGGSIDAVLEYLENATKKLDELKHSKERLDALFEEKNKLLKQILEKGKELSLLRKESAKSLTSAVLNELTDLGMPNANLEVAFKELPRFENLEETLTKNGLDQIEFLFSANLGEPLKPLTKIISGGELSRFMLAIKTVTTKMDEIETMIFDEIDAGISGKMAQAVSKKLAKISRAHQVIVVSHLPQISAMADTHYFIEKTVQGQKTLTHVKEIKDNEIINEIARLLSAEHLTDASKNNAQQLKEDCTYYKSTL